MAHDLESAMWIVDMCLNMRLVRIMSCEHDYNEDDDDEHDYNDDDDDNNEDDADRVEDKGKSEAEDDPGEESGEDELISGNGKSFK